MMVSRNHLMVVIGTRPEAIKLAPLVISAREREEQFRISVVTTGQHREMLDQVLVYFGIEPDISLDIMRHDQDLCHITTAALRGLYDTVGELRPDAVVVQGDTTTTFTGALAASYHNVPVAHVEAGLRTYDRRHPFPEEINRCLTTQLADWFFPPTDWSRDNLLREAISGDRIWVTGNTSIDALKLTLSQAGAGIDQEVSDRMILVTAHRRENHGEPMERICEAVLELLAKFSDTHVLFPVHKSPRVREVVFSKLGENPRIKLVEPLDYREFVLAMSRAYLILTDSGGVQEEAPSLGKPVLVLRETTERPEAVEAGTAKLVGSGTEAIVCAATELLSDSDAYQAMARVQNPYGDGRACTRILDVIASELDLLRAARPT